MRTPCSLRQQGSIELIIVFVVLLVVLAVVGVVAWQRFQQNQSQTTTTTDSSQLSPEQNRDRIRRDYTGTLASYLFSVHLLSKENVPESQAGLDHLQSIQEVLKDPLTNKPYVYNDDQTALKVGEVTFRQNASCDDKIQGSGGKGLIIDATSASVAVAMRLEAGGYVCETNL